ncbi:ras guanine nucleotide exchange factor P-like isoform X2 [Dreissena polymorpha]|uniref:ras guanine nucleotide exchange factor P-like isoform X2 n=1 Tax=Dreissena polymorpha TaxID=45954 RepID=UPI0022654292|nr:ras guanine nucleotide exchange factor P-like isoform X2 [Dreissena polymorpha]
MTAEINSENRELFRHSDGSEIVFFMRPCNERQALRPLIEVMLFLKGGGKVTSKVTQNCIKLAEKGSLVSSDGYYSTEFVEDSVANGKLMDLESYKIPSGTRVRHTSDESERSHLSFGSNDSLSPADYVKPLQNKDLKGRNKYTMQEDVAMMKYLIDTCTYTQAGGNRVWKDMEMMKITSHTAQSMSARFRKTIVPNIEKYRDHIEKHWIPRLTGSLQQAASSSEFSPGVLFQKRPLKKCQPDSTTMSSKEYTSTSGSKHQTKSLQQTNILKMFEGDDETSVTNTAQRKRELVPLEIVSNSKRQRLQGTSGKEKIAENKKDSVSVQRQKGEEKYSESESSSKVGFKKGKDKSLKTSEHNHNNNNNQTAVVNDNGQICELYDGRLTKQFDDDLSNASAILDDQNVSIQSKDEDNGEFSEDLLSLATTNTTQKKVNGGSTCKSSKQCASVDSYVTANSKPCKESANKPKTQNAANSELNDMYTDSLDLDIASSPEEVYLSAEEETLEPDSQAVKNNVEIVPDNNHDNDNDDDDNNNDDENDNDDSFDKMLVHDDEDSFDQMLAQCGEDVEKESSCSSLGKKSTGKHINKQVDLHVDTEKQKRNSEKKSSSNKPSPNRSSNKPGSSKSASGEVKGKTSQTHRKEVDLCKEFCKTIGAQLGQHAAFVNHVLYQCSGDTVRTEAYLKYGPKSKELPPWTSEEDEVLLRKKNSRKLQDKFDENEVEDRHKFLIEK